MSSCIACFASGGCTGACKPRPRNSTASLRAARNAAIERGLAAYIHLACGHLTTREAHEFYSSSKPKGKDDYCESCEAWVKRRPKVKVKPLPTEPMF